MYSLWVGIDVSKDFFSTAGINSEGNESFCRSYSMDSNGFEELVKTITSHPLHGHCGDGIYGLLSHQSVLFPDIPGDPYDGRESSADEEFCEAIVEENEDGSEGCHDHRQISSGSPGGDLSVIDFTGSSGSEGPIERKRVPVSSCLGKRVLQTTFPELETIGDIYTGVMLRLIQEYPSARLVRAAKLKGIAKLLKQPYVGNKLTFTAEDIVKAAQSSVATVSPAKEIEKALRRSLESVCLFSKIHKRCIVQLEIRKDK